MEIWLINDDPEISVALATMNIDADVCIAIQLYLASSTSGSAKLKPAITCKSPILDALIQWQAKIDAQKAALSASAKNRGKIFETNCATCHGTPSYRSPLQ